MLTLNIQFCLVTSWFAVWAFAATESTNSPEKHHLIACRIFDLQGKQIKTLPGNTCVPLDNGGFVAGRLNRLTLYGPSGQVLWYKPIDVHHQINLSDDHKNILVMSSEIHEILGKKTRFDLLLRFDFAGREVGRFSFYQNKDLLTKLGKSENRGKIADFNDNNGRFPGVKFEYSHANSFYQIPPLEIPNEKIPFKTGQYIVNANNTGLVFVLDEEMKKVIWSIPFSELNAKSIHDVQVLSNGHLLYYVNESISEVSKKPESPIGPSQLTEYDPISGKTVWTSADLIAPFYMRVSGGLQRLANGNILFNQFSENSLAREVSPDGKDVWILQNPLGKDGKGNPLPFQQIKRLDLTGFLKKNKLP